MVEITGEMTEKIINKHSYQHIYEILHKNGNGSLLKNGLLKVSQGITTVSEVFNISND